MNEQEIPLEEETTAENENADSEVEEFPPLETQGVKSKIEEVDEKELKIIGLNKELSETKDKYLRTIAEYDNFRKRTSKEKIESYSDATSKAVTEFLAVIDNFERALETPTTDEAFKNGIIMIFNQYTEILKKMGVSEINPVGEDFDPNFHHAVSQVEDDTMGENVVANVFQKGYMLGDRVIRPAMVVVANP